MNTARLLPRRLQSAALRTLALLLPAPVRHRPAQPSAAPPEPRPAHTETPRLPPLREEWLNGEDVELARPYVRLTPLAVPMTFCCGCGKQNLPDEPCTHIARELTT